MDIMHIALGGCLEAPPVRYGLTEDTGGHIAYVLGAAIAQSERADVASVRIVTRLFDDPRLGAKFAKPAERVGDKVWIERIATPDPRYLEKDALAGQLSPFIDSFLLHLAAAGRLPSVIHAHFADAAMVAQAARIRFGIPFFYTPHSLGIDKQACGGADPALAGRIAQERRAIEQADGIIASSRDEAERQLAAYGVAGSVPRINRVAPGVRIGAVPPSTEAGRALIAPFLHDPTRPMILAIARPVRKKNLIGLLNAYATTPRLRGLANLVIVAGQWDRPGFGEGEQRAVIDELRGAIDAHDLHGCVALPPRHDPEAIDSLYRLAGEMGGLFVNPAHHEPFGLTLIEAAVAGLPVIATRNGGPADIVATIGNGLLVDPADTAAIGEACRRVLEDKAMRAALAQAARERAGVYSWPDYAGRSVSLYAAAIAPPVAAGARAMPPRRLIVSDIDNTLTGCAEGTRLFSAWALRRDVPFVVATGRSLPEARAVLADWALPEPDAFIVSVGTEIYAREADGRLAAVEDYADGLDEGWDRAAVSAAIAALGVQPQPAVDQGRHKLSFFGTRADADAIGRVLGEAGLAARIVFSHGHLIDVLAPGAGKAAAVEALAARMGLTLADCIAAGDSGNDIDMLVRCGGAIVVGNAAGELEMLAARPGMLRARAHHANGVMEGLRWFGMMGDRPDAALDA